MVVVEGGECKMMAVARNCTAKRSMSSGFKVLVDGRDVGHDVLPVWSLSVHHLINVQSAFDPHTLSRLES